MTEEDDGGDAPACKGDWAWVWAEKKDQGWRNCFTPLLYYEHTRKEIEREDNITHQRVTWAVSMQTFFMAAVVFLLSGAWPTPEECYGPVVVFRFLCMFVIGVAALVAAWITKGGVAASRAHIRRAKNDWRAYNDVLRIVPEMAPHTFGSGPGIAYGSKYADLIPRLLIGIWTCYLLLFLIILGPFACEIIKSYSSRFILCP